LCLQWMLMPALLSFGVTDQYAVKRLRAGVLHGEHELEQVALAGRTVVGPAVAQPEDRLGRCSVSPTPKRVRVTVAGPLALGLPRIVPLAVPVTFEPWPKSMSNCFTVVVEVQVTLGISARSSSWGRSPCRG